MSEMMARCIGHAYEMGLSDDQIKKIKPVHSEMQKKQAQFIADLKIAEIELMETLEIKKFDLENANNAVNQIAEITKIHNLAMLKAIKEMRDIFSDQQFKEINTMVPMKDR
jgi:hypothetical protein